jgi:hypothetical protein
LKNDAWQALLFIKIEVAITHYMLLMNWMKCYSSFTLHFCNPLAQYHHCNWVFFLTFALVFDTKVHCPYTSWQGSCHIPCFLKSHSSPSASSQTSCVGAVVLPMNMPTFFRWWLVQSPMDAHPELWYIFINGLFSLPFVFYPTVEWLTCFIY